MEVRVDRDGCVGHGQCSATAPAVFDLDDDGLCVPVGLVPAGLEDQAVAGAASCPEQVIEVVG